MYLMHKYQNRKKGKKKEKKIQKTKNEKEN